MRNVIIPLLVFLAFILPARADENRPRRLSDDEIDGQLGRMQQMLPVQIQNGIRWIDIRRTGKEIKYTYIVNIDTASLDDGERTDMIARLQDFWLPTIAARNVSGAGSHVRFRTDSFNGLSRQFRQLSV